MTKKQLEKEIKDLEESQEMGWDSTTQREIDALKKELNNRQ